jgi:hypothetical protein
MPKKQKILMSFALLPYTLPPYQLANLCLKKTKSYLFLTNFYLKNLLTFYNQFKPYALCLKPFCLTKRRVL